jgi:hypothetical protein
MRPRGPRARARPLVRPLARSRAHATHLSLDGLGREHAVVHRDRAHVDGVVVDVGVVAPRARVEERKPPLERELAVAAHLGRRELGGLLAVDVDAHQVEAGVDRHREREPLVAVDRGRLGVAKSVERARVRVGVDAELRLVVVLLSGGPLVPAGRRDQVARARVLHLELERERVLVEVRAAAVLAEGHAQHEERRRPALERAQAAVLDEEPLAAPLEPHRPALLRAERAAREVVEGGRARRARVLRRRAPRLPHPAKIRVDQRGLESRLRVGDELCLRLLERALLPPLLGDGQVEELAQLDLALGLQAALLPLERRGTRRPDARRRRGRELRGRVVASAREVERLELLGRAQHLRTAHARAHARARARGRARA